MGKTSHQGSAAPLDIPRRGLTPPIGPAVRATSLISVFGALLSGAGCGSENKLVPFEEAESTPVVSAPESVGSWLSFDRSPEGQRITMSFYDRDEKALAYAIGGIEDDGSVTWSYERVDGYVESGADVGKYSSQKTAPDGSVWIAYQDAEAETLKVAHRTNPRQWELFVADAGPGVGYWASLALDPSGQPVIAHCDATGSVRLTRFQGSTFTTTPVYTAVAVVDGGTPQVANTALVVAVDREYVAFHDVGAGELHLLRGVAGAFNDEVIDSGGVGAWPSLHVSGIDLQVAYQDVAKQHLKYASQLGSGPWIVETVDQGVLRGADTALFDNAGAPAIFYFEGLNNDLWLATRDGSGWSTNKWAGDEGAVGFHNEVVTVGGRTFAGTYNFTNDGLVVKAL